MMNATLQRNAAARAAQPFDTVGLFGCLMVFVALGVYFGGL